MTDWGDSSRLGKHTGGAPGKGGCFCSSSGCEHWRSWCTFLVFCEIHMGHCSSWKCPILSPFSWTQDGTKNVRCTTFNKTVPCGLPVGYCTDGGLSVAGHEAGLAALLMKVAPSAVCDMIHRALEAKILSSDLGEVCSKSHYCELHHDSLVTRVCCKTVWRHGVQSWRGAVPHLALERKRTGRIFWTEMSCVSMQWTAKKGELVDFLCDQRKMYLCETYLENWINWIQVFKERTHILQLSDWITALLKKIVTWKNNLLMTNYESFP